MLQDLTWDCGCFLTAAQPGTSQQHFNNAVVQQIRSQPYLTSLAQKCYQVNFFHLLRLLNTGTGNCSKSLNLT
jgi:hypothetical protein